MLRHGHNSVSVNPNISQKGRLAGTVINVSVLDQNIGSEKPNTGRKYTEECQQLAKAHRIPKDDDFTYLDVE